MHIPLSGACIPILHFLEILFSCCLYFEKGLEFLTEFRYSEQMFSRNIFIPPMFQICNICACAMLFANILTWYHLETYIKQNV